MTRNEAIAFAESELKAAYERAEKIGYKRKTRYIEVLEMAIKALEQQSMPTIALPDIDKKVESYKELLKHPVIKHIMDMDETQEQLDFVQPPATLTVGDDCISRQQAKAYLYDRIDRLKDNELYDIFSVIIDGMVNELPSVKPQTGHWILKTEDWNKWICSECGHTERTDIHVTLGYDFCPKCGANMSENPTS